MTNSSLRTGSRPSCSRQGRHVLAENSSHYIPFTDADLLAREIITLVDAARDSRN